MDVEISFQAIKNIKIHPILDQILNLRDDLKTKNDVLIPQKIIPSSGCLTEEGARILALLSPVLVTGKNNLCVGNIGTLFILKSVCSPETEIPVLKISGLGKKKLEELAAASYFLPQYALGYREPETFLYFLSGLVGRDHVNNWTDNAFKNKSSFVDLFGLNRSTLDAKLKKFIDTVRGVLPDA